ncbi:MAG: class I SAM-dependent methyltransferase [Ruminococcaceae bacterium]|nr:class I SAM-dependent methyltransferase [Oscillospiraceae bacterium]
MDLEKLIEYWHSEESVAKIKGWDFSYIADRHAEIGELPWDYKTVIKEHLQEDMRLLDIDTGGGEFLLSLGHPFCNTAATENYPPNVALCREKLVPLGVDFKQADGKGALPFEDGAFDVVIDRHGDFNPKEIHRVLKRGGLFITQQVGAYNDRELVELLLGDVPVPFPEQLLNSVKAAFENAGFEVLQAAEHFRPMRFYDVGAIVWFARIIEWEFPSFTVDSHLQGLLKAQELVEKQGYVETKTHRFMLVARKK